MKTTRKGERAPSPPVAEPKGTTAAEPVATEPSSSDAVSDQRLEACEARLEHLEAAFEALQDALYRHEVLVKQTIGELQRRTDPEQIARDLSQDARRRGL
jgi:hypothetical protein